MSLAEATEQAAEELLQARGGTDGELRGAALRYAAAFLRERGSNIHADDLERAARRAEKP